MRIFLISALLLVLGPASASAQTATDGEPSADPADPATAPADAEPETPPPPPAYNGTFSGTVIGALVSTQVVCSGVGSGQWTIQSDPGDDPNSDSNGDGTMINITASRDGGAIAFNVLAGGLLLNFTDSGAVFDGNVMTYAVTASFTGGNDERIEVQASCN